MTWTRREFMAMGTAGAVGLLSAKESFAAVPGKYSLSACDWSLWAAGKVDALTVAKGIGLQGVEISGGVPEEDDLRVADPAFRQQYKAAVKKTGVVVSSLALGLMNHAPLASDPRAPKWLEQAIDAAADLDAKVILMACFGKGDLLDKDERLKVKDVDVVVERLKEAAPRAEKAGVVLGLEDYLSGKDNLAILDRVQSDAVRVYYDVGNSTVKGYNVPLEIRDLGDRICQIHFKDGGNYLGKGDVALPPIVESIQAIDYQGWFVLETAVHDKDVDKSFKQNAAHVRTIFKMA